MRRRNICLLSVLTAGLVLAVITIPRSESKSDAAPAPPPPEVAVLTAGTENVRIVAQLPGRIHSMREAQVRARATGILLKRLFEEGANVQEGDVLFQIDPAPLEAALASAKAAYAKAEAALRESRATLERYRELVAISAISQQVYDEAVATHSMNEAELLVREAAVRTAELELGYTRVTAPISGRIGKAMVTEGALVSATEATELAMIRQLDPVYLDITQSTTEVLRLRRAMENGPYASVSPEEAPIVLILEDGTRYPHPGRLLFSDVSVDPTTGMITLRAEVPNPDNVLLPGMFARAELVQGVITNAVTIPQRTIIRGSGGTAYVLVVNDEDVVERRPIRIEREIESKVVLAGGLRPGERVIVEGSQKAPPGTAVTTVPWVDPRVAASGPNVARAATSMPHRD